MSLDVPYYAWNINNFKLYHENIGDLLFVYDKETQLFYMQSNLAITYTLQEILTSDDFILLGLREKGALVQLPKENVLLESATPN